jgi:hypothetical protein
MSDDDSSLTCGWQSEVALELRLQHLQAVGKAPVPEAGHLVIHLPVSCLGVLGIGGKSGVALGPKLADELRLGVR